VSSFLDFLHVLKQIVIKLRTIFGQGVDAVRVYSVELAFAIQGNAEVVTLSGDYRCVNKNNNIQHSSDIECTSRPTSSVSAQPAAGDS